MTRPGWPIGLPDPDPLTVPESGGIIVPGRLATVGEHGPETFAVRSEYQRGYRAGFDDATEARGGTRLAGCLVLAAALTIMFFVGFAFGSFR